MGMDPYKIKIFAGGCFFYCFNSKASGYPESKFRFFLACLDLVMGRSLDSRSDAEPYLLFYFFLSAKPVQGFKLL